MTFKLVHSRLATISGWRQARLPFAVGAALACAACVVLLLAPFGAYAGSPACVGNTCTVIDTTIQDFAAGQFYLTGLRGNGDGEVGLLPIGVSSLWVTDTYLLLGARSEVATTVFHDILYVIGGYDGTARQATVYTAATSLNGPILAPWRIADVLPQPRAGSVAVVSPTQNGGYLYVLGGQTNGGITSTLVYKALDTRGAPTGQWTAASLPPAGSPVALVYLQAVTHRGYLYVLGGFTGSYAASAIYRAPLNADGSPGVWTAEINAIPNAGGQSGRASFAAVVGPNSGEADYLYVLGGQAGSGTLVAVPDVNFAPFNPDGSLGTFSSAQPLPAALYGHAAVQSGGQIFVTGGSEGASGSIISKVQTSLIDAASGALRDLGGGAFWRVSNPLAEPRQYHGAAINSGGQIYVIGGYAAGNDPHATIYRGSSGGVGSSYASTGNYASHVIDLGSLYQMGSLKWNSDINAGLGETITMQYRTSLTQSGLLAQAWSTAGNSAPGADITNTFSFGSVGANFVQYRALFTITAPLNHSPALNAVEVHYSPLGPDLQVSADDGISSARISDLLTYTINYTNNDDRFAPAVALTETPPLSTTFFGGSVGWSAIGGKYRLGLGSLGPHATGSATFVVAVGGRPPGGLLNNIVEIAYDNSLGTDPNPANNVTIHSDSIEVVDLQVTTTDLKSDVVVSSTNNYTVTYNNAGQLDAPNAIITATIPPGARYVGGSTWTPIGSGQFVFLPGTVAAGSTSAVAFTIFISDTPNVGQAFTQSVRIDYDGSKGPESDYFNNVYSDIDTMAASGADLALSLSDGRETVSRGDVLTYSLGVANVGGSTAMNVILTESLSANTSFVGPGGWTSAGGTVYTRSLGSIIGGDSTNVQFIVHVSDIAPLGPLTNTASVGSPSESSQVLNNNTATDIDIVSLLYVDLKVNVSDGLTTPVTGQPLTYTINYANLGTGPASGVVVTATLSQGLNYSGSGWVSAGNGQFTHTIGLLAAGASANILLLAQVDSNVAGGTHITNSVAIDFAGVDGFPGNNTDADVDYISPPVMVFRLDDGVAAVAPGQSLNYMFQYRNTGGVTATNIVITETPPASSVTVVDASGWAVSGNSYVRSVPDLVAGASANVSFGLKLTNTATAGTLVTNTGHIRAANQTDGGDIVSIDTDIVVIGGTPDLQIVSASSGGVGIGSSATIIVTVTNGGAAPAGNWFFAEIYLDRIPQSRTDLGDDYQEMGDLGPGAQKPVTFTHTFMSAGLHTVYFQVDTCDLFQADLCFNPSYGRIAESNESNNIYGPLNILVMPYSLFLPLVARGPVNIVIMPYRVFLPLVAR
jgi:uncharacterized repeat protein (TIGR01451 family)